MSEKICSDMLTEFKGWRSFFLMGAYNNEHNNTSKISGLCYIPRDKKGKKKGLWKDSCGKVAAFLRNRLTNFPACHSVYVCLILCLAISSIMSKPLLV